MHVPATTQRVPMHTAERVNERIRLLTRQRIDYYFDHRDEIPKRLRELDEEWDIERILEVNASTLALSSLILGLTINKNLLPLSGLGILLTTQSHGLKPVAIFGKALRAFRLKLSGKS